MLKMTSFISSAVFATVLLLGAGALPAQATGLTSAQVQAILSLLSSFGADSATIANVNTSLTGGTSTIGGQSFCYNFRNDLTVGSRGADVSALNQALSSSGVDTTGNDSSFSENDAADVVSFQAKYGIRQTGYVGPLTRAKLNALYGCQNPQPSTTQPTSTASATIDQSSLTTNSAAPTLTGTASGVSYVTLMAVPNSGVGKGYLGGPEQIVNGRWTINLSKIPVGIYTVTLQNNDSLPVGTNRTLATGTLTVTTTTVPTQPTSTVATPTVTAGTVTTTSISVSWSNIPYNSDIMLVNQTGGVSYWLSTPKDASGTQTFPLPGIFGSGTYVLHVLGSDAVVAASSATFQLTGTSGYVTPAIISTTTSSKNASATLDQNWQTVSNGGSFSISGGAQNTNAVYVDIVVTTYTGSKDWQTVNSLPNANLGLATVSGGRWSVSYSNLSTPYYADTFIVYVYDATSKTILTTGTLTIN